MQYSYSYLFSLHFRSALDTVRVNAESTREPNSKKIFEKEYTKKMKRDLKGRILNSKAEKINSVEKISCFPKA